MHLLRRIWQRRAREAGLPSPEAATRERRSLRAQRQAAARPALPVHEAVWRAVEHLEERSSVFAAGDIAAHALGQAPGRYSVEEAEAAIEELRRDKHLVAGSAARRGPGLRHRPGAQGRARHCRLDEGRRRRRAAGGGPGGGGDGTRRRLADAGPARGGRPDPAVSRQGRGRAGPCGHGQDDHAARDGAACGRAQGGGPRAVQGGGAGAGAGGGHSGADAAMVPGAPPGHRRPDRKPRNGWPRRGSRSAVRSWWWTRPRW